MGGHSVEELDETSIHVILNWFHDNVFYNDTDLHPLQVRAAFATSYPLYITLYAIMGVLATVGNIYIIYEILHKRLNNNPLYCFILNLAFSDLFKVLIVMPLTVVNLLLKNWILGQLLCYLLPMMHSFPIHASILTHVMIATHRYRVIVQPLKPPLPAGNMKVRISINHVNWLHHQNKCRRLNMYRTFNFASIDTIYHIRLVDHVGRRYWTKADIII